MAKTIHGTAFVHETVAVDDNVNIGEKTKIWHFSHVLGNSRIGARCAIGQNVSIGPDVTIGDGCKIQNNVSVYKGVTLEDDVFCGPSMVFTNVLTPRAFVERKNEFGETLVKKGATIGANATIVCGHTHLQFIREVGVIQVVNPGSVGMPFDGDRRAAYGLLSPDGSFELLRVEYDVERAIAAFDELDGDWTAVSRRRLLEARI